MPHSSESLSPERAAPDTESRSLWQRIRDALRGETHDYTALPLKRSVLLLAVPMVLEMMMESLFSVADVFWVSRLGGAAVAVVGLTESVMTLVYAIAMGLSIAGTAIVARRIGEGDRAKAGEAAGQVMLLGAILSLALGVVLWVFAADILRFMGAEADVVALGTAYTATLLGGNITVFMIFLINAIFRGAGDAVLAMRTLLFANGLNIILDPCFIFGWGPFPEMGLTGAAVATNIGRGCGVVYQIWHLTRSGSRVRVSLADLVPRWGLIRQIWQTAAPGMGQILISTTSWVGLFKILAVFGSTAVAGYTIAIRVVIFALMPAWGLSNAGATLVGQNLGALKPDRASDAVKIALRYNVLLLGGVGILYIVGARWIVGAFTAEPEVFAYGVQALWIVSLAFPLYAAGMCYESAFNGAGDTWTPTRLNFFCFWFGQIPLAWLLAVPLGLGPTGVFIAVPVSFSVLTLWSGFLFRRGKWKEKKV